MFEFASDGRRIIKRVAVTGITLLSVCSYGCQQWSRGWKNPFVTEPPAYKTAYGPTPQQRMQSLRELAERAPGMHVEEQRRTVQQLSEILQREPDPLIRRESVCSLARFDVPEVEACLQQAIHDPSPEVRVVACRVCAVRPASATMASLLHDRMLQDEHHDVRCAAVAGLASMKTGESLQMASEALRDQDPAMQVVAMNALQKATGQDLGRDVNAWLAYVRNLTPAAGHGPRRDAQVQLATSLSE